VVGTGKEREKTRGKKKGKKKGEKNGKKNGKKRHGGQGRQKSAAIQSWIHDTLPILRNPPLECTQVRVGSVLRCG
jgi:hypothetical protein